MRPEWMEPALRRGVGCLAAVALGVALASGTSAAQDEIVLVAVGDIRLDGRVGNLVKLHGDGYPTGKATSELEGDILFGNLEGPVTESGTKLEKTWSFKAPPSAVGILKAAGFQVLSLANNHTFDYGEKGLLDTLTHLRKAGLKPVGAGKSRVEAEHPVTVEAGGIRVAFLAFTSTYPKEALAGPSRAGVAFANVVRLPLIVAAARRQADVVVVSFHGGTELETEPNPVQVGFAEAAVRAGADLVIGHHPHVLQPVELIGRTPVLHSLGNFLFVSPTPGTEVTAVARIRLTRKGVRHIEFVPFDVYAGRPQPGNADKVAILLDRWGAVTFHPEMFSVRTPGAP